MNPLDYYSIKTIKEYLSKRGYNVTPKRERDWETPRAFSKRHGFGPTWFSKIRAKGRMAYIPPFERDSAPTKRLHLMRSNPELEAWAKSHRKPNRKKP